MNTENLLSIKDLKEQAGINDTKGIYVQSDYSHNFISYVLGNLETNNILDAKFYIFESNQSVAAFLGIVRALNYIQNTKKKDFVVYTDVSEPIEWIKNKKIKTQIKQDNYNKSLVRMLEQAVKWLDENPDHAEVKFFNF